MFFESYKYVWLLWLVPFLFVGYLLFNRRRAAFLEMLIPKKHWIDKIPTFSPSSYFWRTLFTSLGVACCILALMKPYSDFEMREVKQRGVDLYFLLDLSRSMDAQDVQPSRLDRAKREIIDFVKVLTGDRVGLIGYAGTSYVFVPLTSDYRAFDMFLDELNTSSIPVGGTDIKGAINKSVESFKSLSQASGKAVVLITDGEDSIGLDRGTISAINEMGVKVFVIGIGTEGGAPIPLAQGGYKTDDSGNVVVSKLNEAALQNLAMATEGGYVRSVTGDLDLEQIYFKGIKSNVEESEFAAKQRKIPKYEFQWLLLAALVFFCLEMLTTNRKFFWLRTLFVFRFRRKKNKVVATVALLGIMLGPSYAHAFINPFDWEKADQHYWESEYEEALGAYTKLMEEQIEAPELSYNLGNTLYRLKKYKEADKAYKFALNSKDPAVRKLSLYHLGNSAYRQENKEEAKKYYKQTLKMDPEFRPAQLNLEFLEKKEQEQQQNQDQQNQDQQNQDQQNQDQQNQDQQNQDQQNQDQQNQDQQNQDQQNQDQQNQDQQNQDQKDQGDQGEDQKDQGDQGEDQKDQGDQGEDQKDQGDQGEDQKDQGDQGEDQKDQGDQGDQNEEQDNKDGQQGGAQSGQDENKDVDPNKKGQVPVQFKFDDNPDKWLDTIEDNPGGALQHMIQSQTKPPAQKIEKDW